MNCAHDFLGDLVILDHPLLQDLQRFDVNPYLALVLECGKGHRLFHC